MSIPILVKGSYNESIISSYGKVVSANIRYGIGLLTCIVEMFAIIFGFSNTFYEDKVKKARLKCDEEMRKQAISDNCDIIINVKYEFHGLHVFAYGQAARVKK